MTTISKCLAALALLAMQAVASAQVTYNFTGLVTGATGPPPVTVGFGDPIIGTLAFTPVPGGVSTTENFNGGSFTLTAEVNGISWPPENTENTGGTAGTYSPNAAPGAATWAFDGEFSDLPSIGQGTGPFTNVQFASGSTPAWTITGLPVFAAGITATGNFGIESVGGYCCGSYPVGDYEITFLITSMAPPNGPTATISVPTRVNPGQSFTLSWSSTNASNCTASGYGEGAYPWNGPVANSGSLVMQAQPGIFTFWLSCADATGLTATAQTGFFGAPTVTFTTNNAQPAAGQSFTLTWASVGASMCTSAGDGPNGTTFWNIENVGPSGTLTQSWTTAGEYNYILYCIRGPLQIIRSVQVNVGAAAPSGVSTSPSPGHGGGGMDVLEELALLAALRWRLRRSA